MILRRALVCAVLLHAGQSTAGSSGEDLAGIMAMAKYAGFCGAIIGMVHFQDATKMEGGDAFLERYIATETARQGISPAELAPKCKAMVAGYEQIIDAATKGR